ncbi:Alpha-(1,3)-fucosyltransferase C [Armadillidium vulgare]|nr:Alpha-(1,3)-fucosyltransferase C [Armadillidium vulgare]
MLEETYPYNNLLGAGHKIFEKSCCKEKRCFLTDKSDLIPFKEFDAILIQHSGFDPNNLPQESDRTSNQIWIFAELEPAAYYGKGLEKYSNIFNWTMTYRRDSDVWVRVPQKGPPTREFLLNGA